MLAGEEILQLLVLRLLADLVDARGEVADAGVTLAALRDELLRLEDANLAGPGLRGEDGLEDEEKDDQATAAREDPKLITIHGVRGKRGTLGAK